jgi:hypothetical protein
LKANWVAATAGIENPAVMRKASRKNAYLCTLWGRVIAFSVCRQVSDQ